MTNQEEIRVGMARRAHINGRIWPKIYKTEDPHNCKWEELPEYHRELYLAGADIEIEILRSQGMVMQEGDLFHVFCKGVFGGMSKV